MAAVTGPSTPLPPAPGKLPNDPTSPVSGANGWFPKLIAKPPAPPTATVTPLTDVALPAAPATVIDPGVAIAPSPRPALGVVESAIAAPLAAIPKAAAAQNAIAVTAVPAKFLYILIPFPCLTSAALLNARRAIAENVPICAAFPQTADIPPRLASNVARTTSDPVENIPDVT
jgi:hypothetical protein